MKITYLKDLPVEDEGYGDDYQHIVTESISELTNDKKLELLDAVLYELTQVKNIPRASDVVDKINTYVPDMLTVERANLYKENVKIIPNGNLYLNRDYNLRLELPLHILKMSNDEIDAVIKAYNGIPKTALIDIEVPEEIISQFKTRIHQKELIKRKNEKKKLERKIENAKKLLNKVNK